MKLTRRQKFDVVMRVTGIFLGAWLFFSVGFGRVTLNSLVPALSVTYIVVHYWIKRVAKREHTS